MVLWFAETIGRVSLTKFPTVQDTLAVSDDIKLQQSPNISTTQKMQPKDCDTFLTPVRFELKQFIHVSDSASTLIKFIN